MVRALSGTMRQSQAFCPRLPCAALSAIGAHHLQALAFLRRALSLFVIT
jgi:hypothetical protein